MERIRGPMNKNRMIRTTVPRERDAKSLCSIVGGSERVFQLSLPIEDCRLNYRSPAYSALVWTRMGMSGSASFQSVRKSW